MSFTNVVMEKGLIQLEVIATCTESFILGFYLISKEDGTFLFENYFANRAHVGSARCVVTNASYAASGGSDGAIKVFNLNTNREIGVLATDSGAISSLKFYNKYLFATRADGMVSLFGTKQWMLLHELKRHRGIVNDIAVHPSGKLALSVGRDKVMIVWDLMRGKRAFISKLKKAADLVMFNVDGDKYFLVFDNVLKIFNLEDTQLLHSEEFSGRIHQIMLVNKSVIAIGDEDKHIYLFELEEKRILMRWEAHTSRVKALTGAGSSTHGSVVLFSGSSDGYIKAWEFQESNFSSEPRLLAEISTNCRITCLDIHQPDFEVINMKNMLEVKSNTIKETDELSSISTQAKVVIEYPENKLSQKRKLLEAGFSAAIGCSTDSKKQTNNENNSWNCDVIL